MMGDIGFPVEDDVMKPDTGLVFSFPIKAPKSSVFRDDMDVVEQLEIWKVYQEHWTEHKPSVTIYVKEDEWLQAGSWVYEDRQSTRLNSSHQIISYAVFCSIKNKTKCTST